MSFFHFFSAVVLGVVQGLTEFIPVSSSGHLVLFHDIFGLHTSNDLLFDVALHLGTFTALLLFFWKDVSSLFRRGVPGIFQKTGHTLETRLIFFFIVGTIPAALAGFFFEDFLDRYARQSLVVAFALIIVGIIFWIVDKPVDGGDKEIKDMTLGQAFIIGCCQALALIPGVSRSGITIIGGRAFGFKRADAARFSFLLSLPIILAAGLKKLFDGAILGLHTQDIFLLLVGFVSSALVGFFAVSFLMKFLERYSLRSFAVYRFCLALVLLIFLL